MESADHLRFLFGEPSSVTSLEKEKKECRRSILGYERQELTLGNQLTQKQAARECAAWIRAKVAIRSVTPSGVMTGNKVPPIQRICPGRPRTEKGTGGTNTASPWKALRMGWMAPDSMRSGLSRTLNAFTSAPSCRRPRRTRARSDRSREHGNRCR